MLATIKQWFKSKTINYGLLLTMMGVVSMYVETLNTPMFTMLSGLVVIMLRFMTTKPLSEK